MPRLVFIYSTGGVLPWTPERHHVPAIGHTVQLPDDSTARVVDVVHSYEADALGVMSCTVVRVVLELVGGGR